jgi:acyl dehydratase
MTTHPLSRARLQGCDLPATDQAVVTAYLRASLDPNPLHSDVELAKQAGFSNVLVPGMFVLGQMAEILSAWPACGQITALMGRFVEPVILGTQLRFEGRVVALTPEERLVLRLTAGQGRRYHVIAEAVIIPR